LTSSVLERELDIDVRYLRRAFHKAVGRSICKILAEIITNSDDSYKRLERDPTRAGHRGHGHREITVYFDRPKRLVKVSDSAEGLTFDDMDVNFTRYGRASGDRAHRYGTRSLFGKGLRDVLFTQEKGNVRSVKGKHAALSQFRYKTNDHGVEKPSIRIQPVRLTSDIRKGWGVAENGTAVEFRLRKDVSLPQHAALAAALGNFYMLRLINNNPERVVRLVTRYNEERTEVAELSYLPPQGALLYEIADRVTFEGVAYALDGSVLLADIPLKQVEAGYEDRDGGLLVTDEDENVLDLTLFGYDGNPHAARLFGTLKVTGLGALIEDKLNAEVPEELLTETREGFDRRSSFYRSLQQVVDSALKPLVESLAAATDADHSIPARLRQRHRKAFDQLNDLYRRIVGGRPMGPGPLSDDQTPPVDGLAFQPAAAVVTEGTVTPVRLLLNLDLLHPGQAVRLAPSPGLQVFPLTFDVSTAGKKGSLAWKIIRVLANDTGRFSLTAQAGDSVAGLDVTAVPRDVEVRGPMWFSPSLLHVRPGQKRSLALYVNLEVIGQGSAISIVADGSPDIRVSGDTVLVGEPSLGFLFRASLQVSGGSLGAKSRVVATFGEISALADVEVVSRNREISGQSGFFQGYRFKHLNDRWNRPAYLADDGWIEINLDEPLNKVYFGETKESAVYAVIHLPHSQLRLADLVLDEALWKMVMEAYESTLTHRVDPVTDIRLYVLERKAMVGPGVYECFVDIQGLHALMAETRDSATEAAAGQQS